MAYKLFYTFIVMTLDSQIFIWILLKIYKMYDIIKYGMVYKVQSNNILTILIFFQLMQQLPEYGTHFHKLLKVGYGTYFHRLLQSYISVELVMLLSQNTF